MVWQPILSPASAQTIRDLFAELDIELELTGLLIAGKSTVTDIYCPQVRRSPITDDEVVQHLDVVSCWKKLSFAQAAEIAYWERIFKASLEQMMLDALVDIFAEFARQENEPIDSWNLTTCLAKFISPKRTQYLDITIPDLVSDMIERFYQHGSNRAHTWFTSSGDLPSMVFNFIRTRDCFMDSFPYPSLEITFSHERVGCLSGDVKWQRPPINFHNLPAKLPAGAEYRIQCDYKSPALSGSFYVFPPDPEFVVSSKTMPLAWDSNRRCFRALVPEDKTGKASGQQKRDILLERANGYKPARKAQTTFSAKIITSFPGDVRFEQTTRYWLVLEVEPKLCPPAPPCSPARDPNTHYVPDPMDISASSDSTVSIHLSPQPDDSTSVSKPVESASDSREPVSPWQPSYSNMPLSKRGPLLYRGDKVYASPIFFRVDRNASHPQIDTPSHTRQASLWSCANFSDEVGSQVDGVNQNQLPGDDAEESGIAKEQDKEHRAMAEFDRQFLFDKMNDYIKYGTDYVANPRIGSLELGLAVSEQVAIQEAIAGESDVGDSDDSIDTTPPSLGMAPADPVATIANSPANAIGSPGNGSFRHRSDESDGLRPSKTRNRLQDSKHRVPSGGLDNLRASSSKVGQKRKATKQVPITAMYPNWFREPPSRMFAEAIKQLSDLDEKRRSQRCLEGQHSELAAKRQKLGEQVDSGAARPTPVTAGTAGDWEDDLLPDLADITTAASGEASAALVRAWGTCWTASGRNMDLGTYLPLSTKSRAYESAGSVKVMPALKRNGSVKRVVFPKIETPKIVSSLPTPPTSAEISPIDDLPKSAMSESLRQAEISTKATLERQRTSSERSNVDSAGPFSPKHRAESEPSMRTSWDFLETPGLWEDGSIEEKMREIQQNYDEFLKRKQEVEQRASPGPNVDIGHSDDEAAFERVFLENSGSEISSQAVEMDSEWESNSEASELVKKAHAIEGWAQFEAAMEQAKRADAKCLTIGGKGDPRTES